MEMDLKGTDNYDDEEDMEAFMEAVTVYKCKFCAFTASDTRQMAQHVKSTHIVKTQDIENISATKNISQLNHNLGNIVSQAAEPLTSISGTEMADVDNITTTNDISYDLNQLSSTNSMPPNINTTVLVNKLPISSSTDSLSQSIVVSLSDRSEQSFVTPISVNQVQEVTCLGQPVGDYQIICQNPYGQYVLQNSGNVQLPNTRTVDVIVQDLKGQCKTSIDTVLDDKREMSVERSNIDESSQSIQGIVTQQQDNASVEEPKQNEDDVITKELYLCGNCSEGFATIQACKDHMTLVHDVTDFQTSCRVDAGTQVEPKKKPGRKKKSEKLELVKEDVEDMILSDTDEDWTVQQLSYSTRSQRTRKPPQALQNDYYLGRKNKREIKKREVRELNIACEVKGCGVKFQSEETMKKHAECHLLNAGISGPQFKCTVCEDQFDNWKQTRIHMWKAHKIAIDLHSCPLCDNYKTDIPSKLKIHLETHGEEFGYSCSTCGKAFKQFSQMKNHENSHLLPESVDSKEWSERWPSGKNCDVCGRRFVNLKCMRNHRDAVHNGRKEFKCTYCNYECSRKAMLVLHLRIHTGDKPFKCDQCNYSCADHNSLRRHKMRHTGQKPYRCPHCPYACIQAISLKVHVKNKHPGLGGIYCCDLCLYKTVNKLQFENHQKDHKFGLIQTDPNIKTAQKEDPKNAQNSKAPEAIVIAANTETVYTGYADTSNIIQVFQPEFLQNSHIQEVTDITDTQRLLDTSAIALNEGNQTELKQLPVNDDNRQEENYTGATEPNDAVAAQFVYAALNSISENPQNDLESLNSSRLLSGVESGELQTTIETCVKEGETTYKVTFHLSEAEEISREITVRNQNVISNGININLTRETNWQENDSSIEDMKEN